jgi:hypothetical protein
MAPCHHAMPPTAGGMRPATTGRHPPTADRALGRGRQCSEAPGQQFDEDGHLCDVCLRDPASGLEMCLVEHRANPGDDFSELCTGLDQLEFFWRAPPEQPPAADNG